MPLIQPPVQTGTAEELATATAPLIREARQVLNARAVAEILSGLGVGKPQESSALSFTAGLGEAMGAFAKGFSDMSQAQQTLMKNVLEQVATGGKGGSESVLSVMLMLYLMEKMDRSKEPPKDETTNRLLEKFIAHLEEEASNRGPSPIDQQMHAFTQQLLAKHIAEASDPWNGLKKLAEAKKTVAEVLGVGERVDEVNEHALRRLAIEKQAEAKRLEFEDRAAERVERRRIYTEAVPRWFEVGAGALVRSLAAFGLTPVAGGLSPETQAAMAEEEAMAGGAA
jgi:hypothetical protein